VALRPNAGHGLLILEVSRSHTTTHHSRKDFSGRVISSSQRPLPDNTQHSQQTNIHASGGIRTHNRSRRAAADLRLDRAATGTGNLFVNSNVKQLRTGGSFRILLPFFPEHLGVLASEIQQFLTVFTIGLSLARFWRAFGISGGGRDLNLQPQPPPPVRYCPVLFKVQY